MGARRNSVVWGTLTDIMLKTMFMGISLSYASLLGKRKLSQCHRVDNSIEYLISVWRPTGYLLPNVDNSRLELLVERFRKYSGNCIEKPRFKCNSYQKQHTIKQRIRCIMHYWKMDTLDLDRAMPLRDMKYSLYSARANSKVHGYSIKRLLA